ncbi:tetratricopeptide repeat protein [Streptomyces sp. TLI_55]|uniref:tetratricopeptide repeat protein n=1 Tax=Streptomyces sp. TLI_55 TaxID=1938861 RepID=UPI000BE36B48|nr:tetratricopeptide repeat protein [Streptomyces sp. TLI_55]
MLAEGRPAGYPVSLAAQIRLTADRLAAEHPGALLLLSALSLLAPEPFPVTVCAGRLPDQASKPLAQALASRLVAGPVLRAIGRHSLGRVQDGSVQLHRLTQMVLADHLTEHQQRQAAQDAEALLTAANPGDVAQPVSWPGWRQMLPHLLAADPATITTEQGRDAVRNACWYLMDRGQPAPPDNAWKSCMTPGYGSWARTTKAPCGPRIPSRALTATLRSTSGARALDADTLERRRRLLGEEHPDTLAAGVQPGH